MIPFYMINPFFSANLYEFNEKIDPTIRQPKEPGT